MVVEAVAVERAELVEPLLAPGAVGRLEGVGVEVGPRAGRVLPLLEEAPARVVDGDGAVGVAAVAADGAVDVRRLALELGRPDVAPDELLEVRDRRLDEGRVEAELGVVRRGPDERDEERVVAVVRADLQRLEGPVEVLAEGQAALEEAEDVEEKMKRKRKRKKTWKKIEKGKEKEELGQ